MKRVKAMEAPYLRARFELADGSILEREWAVGEVSPIMRLYGGPPPWLEDPLRTWEKPQDPILLTGRVKAGFEDAAREALALA